MSKDLLTDPLAQAFLGTTNEADITRMPGQKADAQKQNALYEQMLYMEAHTFAKTLLHYIMGHHRLSEPQRIWSVALTLFCLRADYPHGEEDFDALLDHGGKDLAYPKTNVIQDADDIARIHATCKAFNETEFKAAATFAEQLRNYIDILKQRSGLTNAQTIYALGRAFHNLRLGLPKEKGGTALFDWYAAHAAAYFNTHGEP